MFHIFIVHSPVDGCLGCFHFLAVVNRAAPNMDICSRMESSLDMCPRIVQLGHVVDLFLAF